MNGSQTYTPPTIAASASTTDPLVLRLYIYILRTNNGTGGVTPAEYDQTLNFVNTSFNIHNIYFNVSCIKYLDNTSLFENPDLVMSAGIEHFDGITLFMAVNSAPSVSGRAVIGGGFCWANCADGFEFYKIAAHELGHVLSLYHTFHGSPCAEATTPPDNPFGDPDNTGDMVADTNPDSGFYPSTCNATPNLQVCNSVNYPDTGLDVDNNIMSGNDLECRTLFTMKQATKMRDHIIAAKTSMLVEAGIVTSDMTLSGSDRYYKTDIVVKAPNTLTVQCSLHFAANRRLIVEAGAFLILDNGVLTNWPSGDCNNQQGTWGGIEVKLSPSLVSNITLFGGTIENANVGVNYSGIHTDKTPLITGYQTKFKNNTASLYFSKVSASFNPPQISKSNLFRGCEFTVDNNYIGQILPIEFVKCSDIIRSTKFLGCKFKNEKATSYNTMAEWYAINSVNTHLVVDDDKTISASEFEGFSRGVQVTKAAVGLSPSVEISRSDFRNCKYSIRLNQTQSSYIFDNNFYVSGVFGTNNFNAYGIYLNYAGGYAIRLNNFYAIDGSIINFAGRRGIFADNSASLGGYINDNSFTGLRRGVSLSLDNSKVGLACNHHDNNPFGRDFEVLPGGQVMETMGDQDNAVGNTFSAVSEFDFFNGGLTSVKYYYWLFSPLHHPNPVFNVLRTGIGFEPTCDDANAAEDDNLGELTIKYNTIKSAYDAAAQVLDTKIDGGKTENLLETVTNATSQNALVVLTQVKALSPYLSEKVAKSVTLRSDIYEEKERFEVLSSNPDVLSFPGFIDFIDEAGISEAHKEQLRVTAATFTQRTHEIAATNQINLKLNRVISAAIHLIISDSIVDYSALRLWHNRLGGFEALIESANTYLTENNSGSWQQAVSDIQQMSLNTDQTTDLSNYVTIGNTCLNAINSGRSMQQFNEQELSQLYLIALANDRYISALAKNILSAYYNYRFEPHQEGLETELIYGRGSNTKSDNTSIGLQSVIVYPNPADDHIIFEISEKEWIPKTIARVQVFDNLGKLVLSSSFDSRKERISTKGLNPNGLYFYQVISQGKTIGTGKFLVK